MNDKPNSTDPVYPPPGTNTTGAPTPPPPQPEPATEPEKAPVEE
jgi:hypothetical protein